MSTNKRGGITTTVVGNLAGDPELGTSQDGTRWARATVASNERRRDAAGQWYDEPAVYTEVVTFGKTAEVLARMGKGTRVEVSGTPTVEAFTRRDGSAGAALKVRGNHVELAPLVARNEAPAPGAGVGAGRAGLETPAWQQAPDPMAQAEPAGLGM